MGHSADSLELMNHPWFKSIDWCNLMERRLKPPYQPKCDDQSWLGNFGEEFTTQDPTRDSIIIETDSKKVDEIDSYFDDFDFDKTNKAT